MKLSCSRPLPRPSYEQPGYGGDPPDRAVISPTARSAAGGDAFATGARTATGTRDFVRGGRTEGGEILAGCQPGAFAGGRLQPRRLSGAYRTAGSGLPVRTPSGAVCQSLAADA